MLRRFRGGNSELFKLSPSLILISFLLAGCTDVPTTHDLVGPAVGYGAMYAGGEDGPIRLSVLSHGANGYLIHHQIGAGAPVERTHLLYMVDRSGIITGLVAPCSDRVDGECIFGGRHIYSNASNGLPYLCGVLIPPKTANIVSHDSAGHRIETSSTWRDGDRWIRVGSPDIPDYAAECRLEGSFPFRSIDAAHDPLDGKPLSLTLSGAQGPTATHGDAIRAVEAIPQERIRTAPLPDAGPGTQLPTPEALQFLQQRSAMFSSFAAENPSGYSILANEFRWAGTITLGPQQGPYTEDVVVENRSERSLTLFGLDSQALMRFTISTHDVGVPRAGLDVEMPKETWTLTEERAVDKIRDRARADSDGMVRVPVTHLDEAFAQADVLGVHEGEVVTSGYRPTHHLPKIAEVIDLEACVQRWNGEVFGGLAGYMHTEEVCIDTATGQITWAQGDWDLITRVIELPPIQWRDLVFGAAD